MKKTLSLLAVTLLGISGGHAAVTLVSGFSRFDQTSPDSGTAVSDLGTKSLSWTLNDALWNNDGTWTSNATNSKKNGLDVSSLQLSGAAGYTVNINFSSAASLDNTDSLFCASIGGTGLNSIVGRYESGKSASGTHHPCFLGDPARRADHSWYCFQYLRLYYLLFCSHQLRHV